MTDTIILPLYRVWVMQPDGTDGGGYVYPWDWGKWRLQTRLIVHRFRKTAGNMGDADLELLRQTRQDEHDALHRYHGGDIVIPRAWCAISTADRDTANDFSADQLDLDKVVWWGFLGDLPGTIVKGTTDHFGMMKAKEVGHLFDQIELGSMTKIDGVAIVDDTENGHGWCQASKDGTYPVPMSSPPTANIRHKDGYVVGNAKALSGGGYFGYVFAHLPEDCGTDPSKMWSRWALATHIINYCKPRGLPKIIMGGVSTIVDYLSSTDNPEVFDLRNLKMRGALDMLFPFTQGIDYRINLNDDKSGFDISVYSVTESDDYGVPASTPQDADLTDDEDVEVYLSPALADIPDEVAFEGAQCLFGFSISYQNRNLDKWWSSDMVDAYDDADDWERNQPQFDDTYTLFRGSPNSNGDLRRSNTPGDTNTNDGPLIPEVKWDGGSASLKSSSRCPYLPTARFTDLIPWEAGRKSDGTDLRDDKRKAQPTYLKPKVFYYDSTLEADKWAELTDSGRINFFTHGQTPEVSADDRAAALRIRFRPKHILAQGDFDGLSFEGQPTIDWQKMIVTIAMPSDQRVRVVKRRKASDNTLKDDKVVSRLTIRDESLGFWCMLKGTVIGLKITDGEPDADRVTATNIDTDGGGDQFGYAIRNDWAKVERNAKRLAAWAFRRRASGAIELAHPNELPSWLEIGALIGTVKEKADNTGAQQSHDVNAAIRAYEVTLGSAPRVTVAFDAIPMPTFVKGEGAASPAGGGGVSPGLGGRVSPSLGGTVPQAVQQVQGRTHALETNDQRKIIYPAENRSAVRRLQIIGGQTSNGIPVITYAADDPTLDKVYNPDTDTTYPDGMGRAWLIDEQGNHLQRVLVRHDFGGDSDYLMGSSPNGGWVYETRGTRILTVASGTDMGKTMRVFLVGWAV